MQDPPTKLEKAVPLSLLAHMLTNSTDELDRVSISLLISALFFCLRSCEYLKTPGRNQKKTRVILLGGIRFFRKGKILSFHDHHLRLADYVAVTIFDQKNGEKFQTVHVERAFVKDPTLCCVHNFAATCQRIAAYSHTTPILLHKLSMFKTSKGNFIDLSATWMIKLLRQGAESMGFEKLGFRPEEIGTHSIRSGGAMAYYLLPGMSDSQVMFFGRWKSQAFLNYIRAQVDRFHAGYSTKIVQSPHFRLIPALDPEQVELLSQNKPDYLLFGDRTRSDPRLRKCKTKGRSLKL